MLCKLAPVQSRPLLLALSGTTEVECKDFRQWSPLLDAQILRICPSSPVILHVGDVVRKIDSPPTRSPYFGRRTPSRGNGGGKEELPLEQGSGAAAHVMGAWQWSEPRPSGVRNQRTGHRSSSAKSPRYAAK